MKARKIVIDEAEIYIEGLKVFSEEGLEHDDGSLNEEVVHWTKTQLQNALRPAAAILNSLRESTKDMAPDEMELSMQFEMGISGTTPVLKIVSAESKFQLAAKFVWKKEN